MPARVASTQDVLGRGEIRRVPGRTALDAVRILRPEFLALASPGQRVGLPVYQDHVHLGGPEALDVVPLDVVVGIRRMRAAEARIRLGPSCPCAGGAIVIRTRR